jgi:integrase
LTRLLAEVENGTGVDPSRITVAEYLREWLEIDPSLSPKTRERYRQLADRQIIFYLGAVPLQKLRPAQIPQWHSALLKPGLSARTVGHPHRVLHRGLARALSLEIVSRNVAYAVAPPKVQRHEIQILTADQIAETLAKLSGHPLRPVVSLALATGARRGELCALTWGAVDFPAGTVRVEASLEKTAAGLRVKGQKTNAGRRTCRRLGHGSPAITLAVYSHLFDRHRADASAAAAVERAMNEIASAPVPT